MSSRKLLIPVVLISLFGLSSVTLAWPEAPYGGTATNNSGSVKTDFHVKVTNDTEMVFKPAKPGEKTKGNLGIVPPGGGITYVGEPTVQGSGTKELNIEWKNLTINDGDTILWSIRIECCGNQVKIEEEWFTPKLTTTDLPIPSLGFEVKQNGEFYLTNHTELPITFDNLLVSIGDEPFNIETMIDTVREVVDTGPGISGTVDNGGELFIERYDELLPGMFLQATMVTSVTTADGATNTSQRIIGHEHPAVDSPTVSQWGLILMVVLLLTVGAVMIVRQKQRKAA
jgi:hypothetical protein